MRYCRTSGQASAPRAARLAGDRRHVRRDRERRRGCRPSRVAGRGRSPEIGTRKTRTQESAAGEIWKTFCSLPPVKINNIRQFWQLEKSFNSFATGREITHKIIPFPIRPLLRRGQIGNGIILRLSFPVSDCQAKSENGMRRAPEIGTRRTFLKTGVFGTFWDLRGATAAHLARSAAKHCRTGYF